MNDAEFMFEYLRDRDIACPGCGYNLRGLVASNCPECNEGLCLRVSLDDGKLASTLFGLLAHAVGAGFSALLILYILFRLARGQTIPMVESWPIFLQGIVQGILLSVWWRKLTWIRARTLRTRIVLGLASWGLTVLLAMTFFIVIG